MLKAAIKVIILGIFQQFLISCVRVSNSEVLTLNSRFNEDFKVAMLIPNLINESSWSQSGYQGLKLIEKDLEAKIAYGENISNKSEYEQIEIIRRYAKSDFNYIIGHGGEFQSAIETVAAEFPRTKFALTSSSYSGNNQNLGVLNYKRYEAGYLAGVVAALATKTNKIGFIGGINYEIIQAQANLLERGAVTTKPNIDIDIEWVGSSSNKVKGREVGRKLIESGIDVLVLNGKPATNEIYPLAKLANISIIEWNSDMYDQAPEIIVTSILIDIPKLVLKGATLVREGRWQGRRYRFGLREGIMRLAPFRNALTSQEKAIVEQAKDDILTGKINLLP